MVAFECSDAHQFQIGITNRNTDHLINPWGQASSQKIASRRFVRSIEAAARDGPSNNKQEKGGADDRRNRDRR
jgi:hypothetical protein